MRPRLLSVLPRQRALARVPVACSSCGPSACVPSPPAACRRSRRHCAWLDGAPLSRTVPRLVRLPDAPLPPGARCVRCSFIGIVKRFAKQSMVKKTGRNQRAARRRGVAGSRSDGQAMRPLLDPAQRERRQRLRPGEARGRVVEHPQPDRALADIEHVGDARASSPMPATGVIGLGGLFPGTRAAFLVSCAK